jgi:hypothetical protein
VDIRAVGYCARGQSHRATAEEDEQAMERESSKAARESIRPRTAANIFLVDDDNEGLSWLDALLQRWGVEIVRYASAEQFLESLVAGQSGVLIVE